MIKCDYWFPYKYIAHKITKEETSMYCINFITSVFKYACFKCKIVNIMYLEKIKNHSEMLKLSFY